MKGSALTDELTLAAEFPTPTREDWLALVDKVLKGGDFHRKLVSRTADGIEIQPLYIGSDAAGPDASGLPGTDPFTRGEASRNRGTGGAGLGLTLARAIAEAHGGRLVLANRNEGGLSAELRLPM